MKKFFVFLTIISLLLCTSSFSFAASKTYSKNGYTLTINNNASSFNENTIQKMADTFFTVYPKLAARFNPSTTKSVKFDIDPNNDGVAYTTGGGYCNYSSKYLTSNPNDIDTVTHEVMHIVQSYWGSNIPGWLTEGIADYARYKYGVANGAAGWSLPNFSSSQKYTDSYRVTARFLAWIDGKFGANVINKLDASGRNNSYTNAIWSQLTGKSLDELWTEYSKNPTLTQSASNNNMGNVAEPEKSQTSNNSNNSKQTTSENKSNVNLSSNIKKVTATKIESTQNSSKIRVTIVGTNIKDSDVKYVVDNIKVFFPMLF